MNILFVLYGDFTSNSANPLALYARELHGRGHSCAVAVPAQLETVSWHKNPAFRPILYSEAIADPDSVFPDGRPADVIHACTPREVIRHFLTRYLARRPTPLVFYLEDNEFWISVHAMGLDESRVFELSDRELADKLPAAVAHPFYFESLIGLADAVAVIQDKLGSVVPPWVPYETVLIGVDVDFFSPSPPDTLLRKKYGIADNENVIVYHGGLNEFTAASIETLCKAVGLINQQGFPCRLLRSGVVPLEFTERLPAEVASAITDLGVLPRSELPKLLALADVFVQPGQINPFEDLRLPGKVAEFLAMGRPVIIPNVNIAHLFDDGVNAVLLQHGSAEEIAIKCIDIFSNPQRAIAIGRAGRLFAEKYFDVRSQAQRLEAVYNIAKNNFNSSIAAKIWEGKSRDVPVPLLLARKLRLLAELREKESGAGVGPMLREHARYIELMQRRIVGLDIAVAERDRQIARLTQSVSEHSTKIVALHRIKRVLRLAKLIRPAVKRYGGVRNTIKKAYRLYRHTGLEGIKRGFRIVATSSHLVSSKDGNVPDRNDYSEWVRRYDMLTDNQRVAIRQRIQYMVKQPHISVVMPVYNPRPDWLIEAIDSVRRQIYPCWELCIADDASTNKEIRPILERFVREDKRIKVIFRDQNGHISSASNSALELASGEWVALLDHDDLLPEHALFWVADTIDRNQDTRMIYSDEDKIDETGRRLRPYFKPGWNRALFYSHNMFCHLGVYQRDLVTCVGKFRVGYEGAQDYDLALRCIEHLKPSQIVHIPRVLYHWRMHAGSTALSADAKDYAMLAGERALNDHFQRVGVAATAKLSGLGYRVSYALPEPAPLVSLIIPTRNCLALIRKCVDSILQKTTYPNYEILIVDNGSDDPEMQAYFSAILRSSRVRIIRDERPFNHSALINAAVESASGEILGLLNNGIGVITPDWLSEMVSYALLPDVGAVGARLWYSNNTLRHGGVVLGIGGLAGHAYKRFPKGIVDYLARTTLASEFSAVDGACLVVRKELYLQVGGLDEINLPVECNDVDFCLKLKEAGYRNVLTPFADLYASQTIEDVTEYQTHVIAYMKRRWGEVLLIDPAYSPNLTLEHEDFGLAWPPRVAIH